MGRRSELRRRYRKARVNRIRETLSAAREYQATDTNVALRDKDGVWRQDGRLQEPYDEDADE